MPSRTLSSPTTQARCPGTLATYLGIGFTTHSGSSLNHIDYAALVTEVTDYTGSFHLAFVFANIVS